MTEQTNLSRATSLANRLAIGPAIIAGLTLFFLMGLTFFDVISRSVFSAPLSYSAELTEMAMAVIVFAALPMATLKGDHIVVDLFDGFFKSRAARIRDFMVDVVCLIALVYPAYRIWTIGTRSKGYNEVTEILNIPQYYLIYFVSIALYACCGIYILRLVNYFLKPSTQDEDL
ncbi:TRAP transporter small permease [Sulfitobacter sp. F26169L]|uniref:TRAP transporter small permease n=1 Tax=Sulfitobacter sp. F26169L TaxID=2996015 RepID=UPI002260C9DF|nr:TRAP transporter small permease [Sulfitobacter sp. F26169L]MCX7565973.1 TRAP transporter small permease [Sulfitobacter sp. F26169L]